MERFNELVVASGYSSYMYLQNVFAPATYLNQPLSVALCLSEQLLKGKGSYRVHGGGLAGTIQAFLPKEELDEYVTTMEKAFGKGCCFIFSIRKLGGYCLI